MESRPVKTIVLHDYLRPMLYDLYTSDIIFDKFEVCCSPDGKSIATGSYRYLKYFVRFCSATEPISQQPAEDFASGPARPQIY